MRISDWSSDVCSSDLRNAGERRGHRARRRHDLAIRPGSVVRESERPRHLPARSEEHTSELQSLMRISYAVFCLKNNNSGSRRLQRSPSTNLDRKFLIHTYNDEFTSPKRSDPLQ